ncbi:MAG TPA: SDR family oxidoreductase [Solirubrobacterales bacterium]|nr:SDR family oxidoreductase [Solirubrobacterales bacterium]
MNRSRTAKGKGKPLAGRVVAITGGARGIGKATAAALAHRGCAVAIGDLDLEEAERTAVELGSPCLALSLDVTDRGSFEAFLAQVEERLGPVDVLINNAGIMVLSEFDLEDDATTQRSLDINLGGVMLGTKLAMASMKARGQGQIINIASQAGKVGFAGAVTYTTSKFAVVGLCEAARAELAGTGVNVSCVMPAVVDTELGSGLTQPRGLPSLQPEDVAEAIVEAIESERFEVWVPRYSRGIVLGTSLLPRRVSEMISRAIGADRVLSDADKAARDEYERRAGRESELSR